MISQETQHALPGIKSIAYVPCELVQRNCDLKCLASMPVRVFTTPIPIILKGEATCATVSQYNKNGRTETTTLRFATLSPVPINKHVAFIVTDTNDHPFLVGLHEAPYPVIKISHSTGTPDGDPAVLTYEVTFKALKSLIPMW